MKITIEGSIACGKSTMANLIIRMLEGKGYDIVHIPNTHAPEETRTFVSDRTAQIRTIRPQVITIAEVQLEDLK